MRLRLELVTHGGNTAGFEIPGEVVEQPRSRAARSLIEAKSPSPGHAGWRRCWQSSAAERP